MLGIQVVDLRESNLSVMILGTRGIGGAMYTYYETLGWLSIDGCSRQFLAKLFISDNRGLGTGQTCGHGTTRCGIARRGGFKIRFFQMADDMP
tara:strand:+ start:229 stop:507 length:279 start_codon:yes stop_codon:yes gene_type:complete